MIHAGTYGAVTHYLKAVAAAGTDDGAAVAAKMKEMKVDDFMTKGGVIRADGRLVRDMYLFQVKSPAELQRQVRLLQAGRDHPGPPGVPSTRRRRLSAGKEELT